LLIIRQMQEIILQTLAVTVRWLTDDGGTFSTAAAVPAQTLSRQLLFLAAKKQETR